MNTRRILVIAAAGPLAAATLAPAQVFFNDAFSPASTLWRNERGAWSSAGGAYFATQPSNSPTTLSTLPFTLGDFDLEVDVNQVSDGGVWIHVDSQAQNGVLLVTGGNLQSGHGLYWHTITNGSYSSQMNQTGPLFNQLDNIHLRITARGPTYTVYLNGGSAAVASLTLPQARTGNVGLYDFASPAQSFDNFSLGVPCYANCDGSTIPPALNVNDFVCFQTKYAAGDPSANCDGSTIPPVLNVNDFVCFLNAYSTGC